MAAAVLFSESGDVAEMFGEMQGAAEHACTLEVTTASRTATVDDVAVTEGDFIGLKDGKLMVAADSPEGCLTELLEPVGADPSDTYEIGTLFYSAAIGRERAEALHGALAERFAGLELELHSGSPDLYAFVLALE